MTLSLCGITKFTCNWQNNFPVMKVILYFVYDLGATVGFKDDSDRNCLHYVLRYGKGEVEIVKSAIADKVKRSPQSTSKNFVNLKDKKGIYHSVCLVKIIDLKMVKLFHKVLATRSWYKFQRITCRIFADVLCCRTWL